MTNGSIQGINPVDATSYAVTVGALLELLPNIAAGFSIIWICYQLWHAIQKHKNDKKK